MWTLNVTQREVDDRRLVFSLGIVDNLLASRQDVVALEGTSTDKDVGLACHAYKRNFARRHFRIGFAAAEFAIRAVDARTTGKDAQH